MSNTTPTPPLYEHRLMTGNTVRIDADGTQLTATMLCGEQVEPFEPITLGTTTATTEAEQRAFFHAMVETAVKGGITKPAA